MKDLLGGKGANLAQMTNLNIPVPKGFTITTEACNEYYRNNEKIDENILKEIDESIKILENVTDKKFGDLKNLLIVSVRSGAKFSMPGMRDTVLNLGLNDEVVESLAIKIENNRFIYDSYRRFIQMFSDVVKGIEKRIFEEVLDKLKEEKGYIDDTELNIDDLKFVIKEFKEIYRRLNKISNVLGTAVNIQEMVFGNLGNTSGTGVVFSRNPANGENKLYGEYLMNAQGEDVVAGIRTPNYILDLKNQNEEIFNKLTSVVKTLESHFKDMQDIEFTIENNKLYLLQTRNGKRTVQAGIKIAMDLYKGGLISKEEALLKIDSKDLKNLLHPMFDPIILKESESIATGLPASPGAAYGKIVFNSEESKIRRNNNEKTILVRNETSPEDIEGMLTSQGVLTLRGGMTSHAAVVARGIGIPCIIGCIGLTIDEDERKIKFGDKTFGENDYISIDGATGAVYAGRISTIEPKISDEFKEFMELADEVKELKVKTNADNSEDAKLAIKFGAEGIGLCRTEHMFFEKDRIRKIRQMILSTTMEQREKALEELLPIQRKDFEQIYEVLKGKDVTIRLLDPPLHEFLPSDKKEILELAIEIETEIAEIYKVIESLHEFNPMMGLRGCRLGIILRKIL